MNTIRICLWSGPRNISTAMMRSFENRADCEVWDEPYYGYYLDRTGLDHPGREAVLGLWPTDEKKIAARCGGSAPEGSPLFFQKHMCQHMLDDVYLGWTARCRHLFLIRDPAEMAASFNATMGAVRAEDLGSLRQHALYEVIAANTGRRWPVVEGADVLADPEGMLRAICTELDIAFDPAMLNWPDGQRASDGPWAPYWYSRVEASTGFEAPAPSRHPRPDTLQSVIDACQPAYLALKAQKLAAA
ncbi:MAG: hypothetical protein HLUCCA04_11380 [Oceanicaulis sp. HLUCCA04]|nr:MAG: hypothetical protein HLUCCA04_11380 [Oceanicaulis sp. HLUCCA04]